ncbi:hypothetical protein GCM10017673_37400 [Streptosporangium violaceochromogenes]|nr:hypothetical protein GCM10017673_37400 [Streptosporangium violaceochromogenes]
MRRLAPVVAVGAAALVAVSGCGAQGAASLGNVKLAAADAVQQSAQKAGEVTSYSADIVLDATGGKKGDSKVRGSVLYQGKPSLATDVKLDTITFNGRNVPGGARVILTGNTVYAKSEAFNKVAGTTKPWVKVSLDELDKGDQAEAQKLMGQAQQFDLAGTVKLLTASKDVKAVGTESVGGVETTHYSGTFPVDEAAQVIDPAERERLQGQLSHLKNVKFDLWSDAQSLPRKVTLSGSEQGVTFNLAAALKGFNEPVQIVAPPADQVGVLPDRHGESGGTGGN